MKTGVPIANYELNDYKYRGFWEGRRYEHEAEMMLLSTIFEKYIDHFEEKRIIDVGGAYGRLADLYAEKAKQTILADYSTHELADGIANLKDKPYFSKIAYLAMNAYKIPLKENAVDIVLSVRVMHHLKDTQTFFSEIYRILTPGGIAIIEFANKTHLLARLRNLFSRNKHETIAEVSHKSDAQGIKENQISVMYNFSPEFIKKTAENVGFRVKETYTCSFLRLRIIKKVLPLQLLLALEKMFQRVFQKSSFTPSIFVVMQKDKQNTYTREEGNILCCPICRSSVEGIDAVLKCSQGHSFVQKDKMIIDLRDPRPETIEY